MKRRLLQLPGARPSGADGGVNQMGKKKERERERKKRRKKEKKRKTKREKKKKKTKKKGGKGRGQRTPGRVTASHVKWPKPVSGAVLIEAGDGGPRHGYHLRPPSKGNQLTT